MKRVVLMIVFPVVLAGSGMFTACQEKAKTAKKEAVHAPETPKTVATPEENPVAADTAMASTEEPVKSEAGAQKFGHINSADLIKIMPETKKAEASLAAYVKTLEGQLTGLQNDYKKKVMDYQSTEKTMVDAIKATKIQAIQSLEQQMQEAQAMGREKVAAKRETLFKPILDKAEKAIKEVGKENDYDYVFDTNSGAFIYTKESHDVMPLVKAKLGLK